MGAMTNTTLSALAGMMSSLRRSLIPSAMLWAQPCQPPTRIGPKRTWMWALILRSHQIMNMDATEM